MFPYSHLVLASRLQTRFPIRDVTEFNLGAVVADVRYVDGSRWEQTHLTLPEFAALPIRPEDEDFAWGYRLHLAMDWEEPWFIPAARRSHILGRLLPRKLFKLLLEGATLEAYPLQDIPLSKRIPDLAVQMGIAPESIRKLRGLADHILAHPTLEEAFVFVRETDLAQVGMIRWLMVAARVLLQSPLRHLLLRPAKRIIRQLEPELEQRVLARLQPFLVPVPAAAVTVEATSVPVLEAV